MSNQGRRKRRAPRQRGRGRKIRVKQRGRGKIRDLFKKAGSKISHQIRKIIKSRRGQKVGRKALHSFVKAGADIALRGANPKTTIKNTLKQTGSEVGRELVSDFLDRK